jgi:hypothetical protein
MALTVAQFQAGQPHRGACQLTATMHHSTYDYRAGRVCRCDQAAHFFKKVAKHVEIYIEIPPPPQQTAKIDPLKAAFPPYPQLAWR